jgi:hypothetical protein
MNHLPNAILLSVSAPARGRSQEFMRSCRTCSGMGRTLGRLIHENTENDFCTARNSAGSLARINCRRPDDARRRDLQFSGPKLLADRSRKGRVRSELGPLVRTVPSPRLRAVEMLVRALLSADILHSLRKAAAFGGLFIADIPAIADVLAVHSPCRVSAASSDLSNTRPS